MHSTVRGALAVVVAAASVAGLTGTAVADRHKPIPTKQQVAHAQQVVVAKAGDVASIRAALVLARSKLEAAATKAEIASEAYNGAQWRLGEAKKATAAAVAASQAATAKVTAERAALAALAAESYQNGSAISSVSAFFGSGGPEQVMDDVSVTQSAAGSLQSRYEQYRALDALAKAAQQRAKDAQATQEGLVREAGRLRDAAAVAVQGAQNEASAIAVQRRQLIVELASAQKISVRLAQKRQSGLERIAAEKAAAAAAAKARAEAEKAKQQAAANAASGNGGSDNGGSSSGAPSTPVATTGDAARAIAFARAQLGEMYLWAAAGPDRWDCSGLTMMAWRAAGVSLPHYSAAQYAEIQHIGVEDLRPGDLVFWGGSPGSIHHVAMYLGNDMIIQAPHTGAAVDIESMYAWSAPNYFGRP